MSLKKQKLFPINKLIKLNAILTNNLPLSPKLKKIVLKNKNGNIKIETISDETLNNSTYDIGLIQKESDYVIPISINCIDDYSGIIGDLTIKWTDDELIKFSPNIFNSTIFTLPEIDIKSFDILMECEYAKQIRNKEVLPMKIHIKNTSNEFKKIVFLIDNSPNFIVSGSIKKKLMFYPLQSQTLSLNLIPLSFGKIKIPPFKIMEFPLSSVGYDNKIYSIYYLSEFINSV